MAPYELTIPGSTRLVEANDCGSYYPEITPEIYKVMKNVEHREWLQREALEEFIQLNWTTPRYTIANILEMSRTWDSDKKCCTANGTIVDLSLDALSSYFRLRGYGKKPRVHVKNWVSRFFDKAALRNSGYLTSACKSSDVGHRIKFVTLTLHVNWIRSKAPRSIVQAVELSRSPEKKDWLGRMVHAFWKAMDKSQKMPATYVLVLLKAHLRIILDSVLRPDAVLPKSIRTRVDPTADLNRQAKKKKTASIIQRARMGNPKPVPRTRWALKQALTGVKKILVTSTAQIKTGRSAQTRRGGLQLAQRKLVAGKPVAKREEEEEDVSGLRAKECNEPEPGEKEESNKSQLEEEDAHESNSVIDLSSEEGSPENLDPELIEKFSGYADGNSDTKSDSSSDKEGAVHAGAETEREAEEIPGGATYMGSDPPRETENEEMDVDPPKPSTVDLTDAELLATKQMKGMFQEDCLRELNRERREWDSERIKSQNRIETIEQENHELQQQLNNYRLQVMHNQKSKAEEEAAWREKHVDPVLEELAVKEKYILTLKNVEINQNLELERVREQTFKCAKELTFNLFEKTRLEKESEELKAERVEQGKRIKDLEERVEKVESELETTRVSLMTSQNVVNERDKSVARANKVVKGLQERIEKMPPEIRKCYNLNLFPESEGSKKRKTEH